MSRLNEKWPDEKRREQSRKMLKYHEERRERMEELDEFEKWLTTLQKTSLKDGVEVKSKANSVAINTVLNQYRIFKSRD